MSSLNKLTSKDFAKDHHRKGYKELGRSYVKIIFTQNNFHITAPLKTIEYGEDVKYEHVVWDNSDPIAEFKNFDDAHDFVKMKLNKR